MTANRYETLISIGGLMSNICFNASQTLTAMSNRPEEIERLKHDMRKYQRAWDDELTRLRTEDEKLMLAAHGAKMNHPVTQTIAIKKPKSMRAVRRKV